MKHKIIFIGILSILELNCSGQNSIDSIKIKNDFEKDSLGCLGLRINYIDSSKKIIDPKIKEQKNEILIGGISFENQTRDSVVNFIGKPNESDVRREYKNYGKQNMFIEIENIWYYLTTCGKDKQGKTLLISVFNGKINKVSIIEK